MLHYLTQLFLKEGDSYCCILGPDPQTGIVGCADTPEGAVKDWDETLQIYLEEKGETDPIVKHVRKILSQQPPTGKMKEFYDQFRPVKRK